MSGTTPSCSAGVSIAEVRGTVLPLPGDDIDTDQIIASRYLRWTTFDGLEAHVFEDARLASAAAGRVHPFDDPRRRGAAVLLVGRNFGCGSSREHAPQALRRAGFRAILGQSFGEIFAANCHAVGITCAQVSKAAMCRLTALHDVEPAADLIVDIAASAVRTADAVYRMKMPEGRRRQLMEGSWDAPPQLLRSLPQIDAMARRLPPVGLGRSKTGAI